MNKLKRFVLLGLALLPASGVMAATAADQELRIREFVVMGYHGIELELQSKSGPYLRTLLELMGAPAGAEAKLTGELKGLLKARPNIMDFADQVAALRAASPAQATAPAPRPIPEGKNIYSGDRLVNALEHLTRGMEVRVTLKTGEQLKGRFSEYISKRLWLVGAARKSVSLDDISFIEAPEL